MAATKNKYSQDTLNAQNNGEAKQIYALQPLALAEYQSKTQYRELFFLDEVWFRKDRQGKQVAIGLVKTGSFYSSLHASERKGKLRLNIGGEDYIVLNDGGLNTMAFCRFRINTPTKCYTNYIKVLAELRSAYYSRTDNFTVHIYKDNAELYSFALINDNATGDDKRIFPAKFYAPEFAGRYKEPIGGLAAGDTVTLTITSTNEEGEYTCASVDLDVLGAMEFVQVYYFATKPDFGTTDPTTGVPYAMLISEDMYNAEDPMMIGSGGVLWRLFQAQGDPITVYSGEYLQGAQGMVEDAYDATLTNLPNGYYYGVPYPDYAGSQSYVYVQVDGSLLYRYFNQYHPVVPTAYTVTMSFRSTYDPTYDKYLVDVYAQISGTRPTGGVTVTTTVCVGVDRHGNPIDVQFGGPISKTINTGGLVKINDTPIVCDAGEHFQTINTSGSPSSTITNYITEGNIAV